MKLQQGSEHAPILTNGSRCLHLYPYEDWCEFERRIAENPTVNPDFQAYKFLMLSGATECPIDKQGRMLVPQYLRDHAGLDRDVTIAGVGQRVEIWDKVKFDAHLVQTLARYDEIASTVAGLTRKES